jgi:hypothetical protein
MHHQGDRASSSWIERRFDREGALVWASARQWKRRRDDWDVGPPQARDRAVEARPFRMRLVPLAGCGPLTPQTVCTHEPFARCSPFYCIVCHQTGWDWHPALQLDADETITRRDREARAWRRYTRDLAGGKGRRGLDWKLDHPRGKRGGFRMPRQWYRK